MGRELRARNSEVLVSKGEVLIKNKNEPDSLRLTENRATRIELQTRTPTGIPCQPGRFIRTRSGPGGTWRALIGP